MTRNLLVFGTSLLIASSGLAQPAGKPAELCRELLAYADMKSGTPSASAAAAPSHGRSSGSATSPSGTPPTVPRSTGAAGEPVESPYTGESSQDRANANRTGGSEAAVGGGVTLREVRETAVGGNRQACRTVTQALRRAGADLPAELIALAAYEPDPDKRD